MSAVDFSFARFTVAQLKAAGVTAVGRYLAGSGKAISAIELSADLLGGLSVFLVFEIASTDGTSGAAAGAAHAAQANVALVALGLPTSTPVYFAADASIANPASAVPYWQGLASVRPAKTNGVYGEGALLNLLFADGLVGYGWESESTSFPGSGSLSPNAALWQRVSGAPLGSTDNDLIEKADFGQLPRPVPQPQPNVNPPPPPIHTGDSTVQTINESVAVKSGSGWIPSPVNAAKFVNGWFAVENPDLVGHYDTVPTDVQASATPGPHTPNGAIIVHGLVPDGTYAIVLVFED